MRYLVVVRRKEVSSLPSPIVLRWRESKKLHLVVAPERREAQLQCFYLYDCGATNDVENNVALGQISYRDSARWWQTTHFPRMTPAVPISERQTRMEAIMDLEEAVRKEYSKWGYDVQPGEGELDEEELVITNFRPLRAEWERIEF